MSARAGTAPLTAVPPRGFLRAEGTSLVDDAGPRLPRGVGLGNWLLPEGYMWLFGPGAESPREIERLVARLAGEDYATQFWTVFRDRYITERDIARIAELGFDHVRVPINARVIQAEDGSPLADGMTLIDNVIEWCRTHGLRALLDLHGAPGGQTGTNIDDSPHGRPDLFLEPRNAELTVRLWSDLATRYAHDEAVMGYDLLNEPLPHEWRNTLTPQLIDLYQRLTAAVREVDDDHLIMYEGTHWATDFSGFTERWDDNQVLQFHRYWSRPDREGIAPFLHVRDRLASPLYMGEGGENTTEWIYTAMRLYESEGIGWNLWPWKKLATTTSPVSIDPPDGWDLIRGSISGDATVRPDEARDIFDRLLDAMLLENTVEIAAVTQASLGTAPPRIPAWGFGFDGAGTSYDHAGIASLATFRPSDAVAVRHAVDVAPLDNPFQQSDGRDYDPDEVLVVDLPDGGWLEYAIGDVEARSLPWHAVDEHGSPVDAPVTATARGIRVTAPRGGARFAALVRPQSWTMEV